MTTETTPIKLEIESGSLATIFKITGRLDTLSAGDIWSEASNHLEKNTIKKLILDVSGVNYCDGAGISFIMNLKNQMGKQPFEVIGLQSEFQQLYDLFAKGEFRPPQKRESQKRNLFSNIGSIVVGIFRDCYDYLAYTGELLSQLFSVLSKPGRMRWRDLFSIIEAGGVNALPIILLIGFLVGLIMAFQAAIPMRQFGADIFVADLVGLSVLRELGPLMTAIILAGSSGSAFAAELGTMKVNEEINALYTMGLDPVRFLVTYRVLAVLFLTPFLTVFADAAGLVGGAVVMKSLGYPVVTYLNQLSQALHMSDFLGGIVKSFAFGILVAAIGCLRGMQTQTGASAVGRSATRAVVSCLIMIVFTDGIFLSFIITWEFKKCQSRLFK